MDHLQPSRVDPRKQALLEARFFSRDKVTKIQDIVVMYPKHFQPTSFK